MSIIILCSSSALASHCTVPQDARLDSDDATNVQAFTLYKEAASEMLLQGRYAQLDCLANSLRASKQRFSGGMWKLHALYSGLASPLQHPTEPDWKNRLAHLKAWSLANPTSVTARIAWAQAFINYGWYARGDGTSDTVSDSGWELFAQRAARAKKILQGASSLKTKCPEWYVVMMGVATAESWGRPQAEVLVDQAFALEPEYYYVYRLYANYLLPKWYGDEGDTERFAAEIADRIGGKRGDEVYFQVAGSLVCNCNNDPVKRMSWQRIQNGFTAIQEANGLSLTNMNMLALIAMKAEDYPVADRMFKQIGDQWNEGTWHQRSYFYSMKNTAARLVPTTLEQLQGIQESDANGKTPEGIRYEDAFEKRFASIIRLCKKVAPSDTEQFDLLLKISEKGAPKVFMTTRSTALSSCLFRNLLNFQVAQTAFFPPPPRPDYWLRLPLDPSGYSAMEQPTVDQGKPQ